MKAVIYARFSSDNQREESIEGQIRECMEYTERNGITVVGNYIDRALSAKTDNRPNFQKMIKDSYKGLFDLVIVWKLDRFARNRYDSAHYKTILKKNGVKVVSARESIAEGSEGILLESVLEGYAEYFSADLAEKVNRGMMENALKCMNNGAGIPLGYYVDETQHLQIDEKKAPYYKCNSQKRKHNCDKKTVSKDFIEDLVVSAVAKKIMDDELMEHLANSLYALQLTEDTKIPQLKSQLAEVENGIENMLNAIQQGIILDSTKKRLADLEERKKTLEVELIQEQIRKPILTKEQILFGITKFRTLDLSTKQGRQTLIDSFVNTIYLYDDYAIFTCNYKDGTTRISFEEIESSDLLSNGVPVGARTQTRRRRRP